MLDKASRIPSDSSLPDHSLPMSLFKFEYWVSSLSFFLKLNLAHLLQAKKKLITDTRDGKKKEFGLNFEGFAISDLFEDSAGHRKSFGYDRVKPEEYR